MPQSVEDDEWVTGVSTVGPVTTTKCDRAYLIVLAGDGLGEMHLVADAEAVIGRAGRVAIALRDDGVSRTHARVRRVGAELILEDLGSRNGTYLNGERVTGPVTLRDGDKIYVGHRTVLRLTYHDDLDDAFQKQLREAAMYDALTRAFSRRHFCDRLETELQYAMRHQTPLSIVLLDLDRLKDINDTYGHAAGDRALVEVAATVQSNVRAEDLLGRLGGDEFGVLCRGSALQTAALFAERMRGLIEAHPIDLGPATVNATVSTGVAAFPDLRCVSPGELVDAADRALYIAKARGRNRVAVIPDPGEETRVRQMTVPLPRRARLED
jgi:diguanylate cyclase (GGDEF)-like protein